MTTQTPLQKLERIDRCPNCGVTLPLREPSGNTPALRWMCAFCAQVINAALDSNYEISELRNLRIEPIKFDRAGLAGMSPELVSFHRKLSMEEVKAVEKRASTRYPAAGGVPVQPLDRLLEPAGEAFLVMGRNISTSGIGLLHDRPVSEPFMAVEMDSARGPMQLLTRIVRCRPMGPHFDLAGEFISKMIEKPG